jgi:hypothetical protein
MKEEYRIVSICESDTAIQVRQDSFEGINPTEI